MIDRMMLHQLIDALPEERLQNVERVLQYEGIAPSSVGKIPDEVAARIREQLAKRPIEADDWDSLRTKMSQGIERRRARFPVHPQFEMRDRASTACQGIDKDGALLFLTFRYFKRQKLELAERLSFSQQSHSVRYSHDITGPDGKHVHHEAEFAVPESV